MAFSNFVPGPYIAAITPQRLCSGVIPYLGVFSLFIAFGVHIETKLGSIRRALPAMLSVLSPSSQAR